MFLFFMVQNHFLLLPIEECNVLTEQISGEEQKTFSQLLKQWRGGEMHYGRIYKQYFALWSSH